ncbi:hypothetical protein [Bradyrhizobium sp. USDA 4486]
MQLKIAVSSQSNSNGELVAQKISHAGILTFAYEEIAAPAAGAGVLLADGRG